MLVMFDLPVSTKEERRIYTRFRKALLSAGYQAVQKSVYVKLLSSARAADGELAALDGVTPRESRVYALPMTLAQFRRMVALSGAEFDFAFFSDDILCISA